jgi:hypothetical protein
MTDRECALRFCAFVLTRPKEYAAHGDLDRFLHAAMKAINALSEKKRRDLAERFVRTMSSAESILGDQAFRKPSRSGRRAPVNKALFEVWAVGFDGRSDAELKRLAGRRQKLQQRFEKLFNENREFERALSQGTGDPTKVVLRFSAIAQLIEEVLV